MATLSSEKKKNYEKTLSTMLSMMKKSKKTIDQEKVQKHKKRRY